MYVYTLKKDTTASDPNIFHPIEELTYDLACLLEPGQFEDSLYHYLKVPKVVEDWIIELNDREYKDGKVIESSQMKDFMAKHNLTKSKLYTAGPYIELDTRRFCNWDFIKKKGLRMSTTAYASMPNSEFRLPFFETINIEDILQQYSLEGLVGELNARNLCDDINQREQWPDNTYYYLKLFGQKRVMQEPAGVSRDIL